MKKLTPRKKKILIVSVSVCLVVFGTLGILAAKFLIPKQPDVSADFEDILYDDEGNPIIITGADRKPEFFNILVFGSDKGGGNTDTIMVFSLDVKNGKYNVLSVPRDTMTRSVSKINSAYAYGGTEGFKKELNNLLGFKPDKYVKVSLDGFIKIIDAMGGIDVDVAQNMNYDDPAQNLHIHLQKGPQHLNGVEAMGYVRFRGYPMADLERIKVQQSFINAVVKQMRSPSNIVKIPGIIKECFSAIETDMTLPELLWLASIAKNISEDQALETHTLPGYPHYYNSISYYIPSAKETLTLVNESFNPYNKTIPSLNVVNFSAMLAQQDAATRQAQEEALRKDQEAERAAVLENNPGADTPVEGSPAPGDTTKETPSSAPPTATPTPSTAPTTSPTDSTPSGAQIDSPAESE